MKLLKRSLSLLLSICLGLVFIFSAYTKLIPVIETFEFSFVDTGLANWYVAPVLARLMIGLELFLGILLVANYKLKRFTLPLSVFLLLFFIVYLIIQIIINGNSGNCGCFGEQLIMTPLQGILKNIIMIVLALMVYFTCINWELKYNGLLVSLVALNAIIAPFIVNPVDYTYTSNNLDEKVNYPLELNLLYEPEDSIKVEIPKVGLRKGKQVLAFLSLTCSHCRIAAKKFRLLKKENPKLPIYFILNGDRSDFKAFIEDTRADNIPYSFCLGKTFIALASSHLPRIYYLDNSIVVKKVDYFELNQYAIEKWIAGSKIEP